MKITPLILSICLIIFAITGCGKSPEIPGSESEDTLESALKPTENTASDVDIDLTAMSNTMVYSEVALMMFEPDDYKGKNIRMRGSYEYYENEETGEIYNACVIQDATACCAQGIEFNLTDAYAYPEDYPEEFDEITVVGTFDTYYENDMLYCTLRNAVLE